MFIISKLKFLAVKIAAILTDIQGEVRVIVAFEQSIQG